MITYRINTLLNGDFTGYSVYNTQRGFISGMAHVLLQTDYYVVKVVIGGVRISAFSEYGEMDDTSIERTYTHTDMETVNLIEKEMEYILKSSN